MDVLTEFSIRVMLAGIFQSVIARFQSRKDFGADFCLKAGFGDHSLTNLAFDAAILPTHVSADSPRGQIQNIANVLTKAVVERTRCNERTRPRASRDGLGPAIAV